MRESMFVRLSLVVRAGMVAVLLAGWTGRLGARLLVDALRRTERATYYDLVLAVVAGYYHSEVVRDLIGYPGQEARPVSGLDFPEYVSEGLLDAVLTRGPVP